MTDESTRQPADIGAQIADGPSETAPQPKAEPDPVEAAQWEAAEYKDKLLRPLAEMENLRPRRAGRRRQHASGAGSNRAGAARTGRRQGQIAHRGRRAHRTRAAQITGKERGSQILTAGREI